MFEDSVERLGRVLDTAILIAFYWVIPASVFISIVVLGRRAIPNAYFCRELLSPPQCPVCGYDRGGLDAHAACPECGGGLAPIAD
jgi:predicted RNA-binding Zn-ribbon protein involved in translation (DUF1610 family)